MELNIGPRKKTHTEKGQLLWHIVLGKHDIYEWWVQIFLSLTLQKKNPIQFKMDKTSYCKIWNPEVARGAHGQDRHVKTGHKQGLSEKIYFNNK